MELGLDLKIVVKKKEKREWSEQIMFQGKIQGERRKERQDQKLKNESPRGNKVVLKKHRVPGHRKTSPSCSPPTPNGDGALQKFMSGN